MHTYHIHINGLVQGVGFRPYVCRLAREMDITGEVCNANDGVHIECNSTTKKVARFYNYIVSSPPANAIINHHSIEAIASKSFSGFAIKRSSNLSQPDLLLTPDIAICSSCREEIFNAGNKRFHYPFTTCLNCGPRYAIIKALPYDREHTTMSSLRMCNACNNEYHNIENIRHYSQTNSCKDCAIPIHLYSSSRDCISSDSKAILDIVTNKLNAGNIIAVKGIGGYLLLCDATSELSISTLRIRKHRPHKPLALLYTDIAMAEKDVALRSVEINALKEKTAPIVLCKTKQDAINGICKQAIAPGLHKIGLMLAYTPLLLMIATEFGKPLVATSGNISGSPILYKDEDALQNLFEVADYILSYERDIVAPQDDSVIQFTESGQKIILRRSRGLAPNYFPNPFQQCNETALAMGAELKSAFAMLDQKNLYISQFLGDQGTLESQTSFKDTLQHVTKLLQLTPKHVIVDKHPGYFVSQFGKRIADENDNLFTAIQHHKAHFGAVLAENNLLQTNEPVLGFIWDGTGYGDDEQIWGGEVFSFENDDMDRVAHLDYFPQLLGDKMSREPRLSALCLLKNFPKEQSVMQEYFSKQEWQFYQQLVQQPAPLLTSSMGRFLDGIAAIMSLRFYNTYEGEAAMQLEALASKCSYKSVAYYPVPLIKDRLDWSGLITELINDLHQKQNKAFIARKVFYSLSKVVEQVSNHFGVHALAFSGGVFQNALLVDMIKELLPEKKLYFHKQLSPNDECIGFGQLACLEIINAAERKDDAT